MSVSRSRRSRVFTVSFPEDLARQVDEVADRESRNISELFREAFRVYRLESVHNRLQRARAAARLRQHKQDFQPADVERMVDEIRASPKKKKK